MISVSTWRSKKLVEDNIVLTSPIGGLYLNINVYVSTNLLRQVYGHCFHPIYVCGKKYTACNNKILPLNEQDRFIFKVKCFHIFLNVRKRLAKISGDVKFLLSVLGVVEQEGLVQTRLEFNHLRGHLQTMSRDRITTIHACKYISERNNIFETIYFELAFLIVL